MSASPVARQVVSQAIPISRRVVINHESELPNDLSSTPGGSLFSTTPGGTRVYYDRSFMLSIRSSPLARTPLANLPIIRGVTVPDDRPKEVIEKEEAEYRDPDDNEDDIDDRIAPSRTSAVESRLANRADVLSTTPPKDKEDDDQFDMDL